MSAPVWQDLAGQDHVIADLSRAAQAETPSHAWLFTGPPGSGRSTAARAFAQALECEQEDPAQRGCGQCHACSTVRAGTHADVKVVSTEKVNYKIEEIRELIGLAQDRPATGRWRIFIIEDADRMTERATNVLLKAIEEPPARTLWMLCAPSPADVLVTIRSRTRHVALSIPSNQQVADLLVKRDNIDPQAALVSARASQSHVGVARWLATNEGARRRRDAIVRLPLEIRAVSDAVAQAKELVDLTQKEAAESAEQRNATEKQALLRSLGLNPDENVPPKLRHHVRRMEEEQTARNRRSVHDSLDRALIDLTGLFRDVLAVQLNTGSELINEHLRDQVGTLAHASTAEHSVACIDAISETRSRLVGNVQPQVAIEALFISFIAPTSAATSTSLTPSSRRG